MKQGNDTVMAGQADQAVDRAAVRPLRIPLELRVAPDRAALLVRGDPHPFALIGRWAGGGALVGSAPVRVAAAHEDPFELLDSQPAVTPDDGGGDGGGGDADGGGDAVGGGWFGYLGYELGRAVEPVGPGAQIADRLPRFRLAFYDHLVRCDRGGQWWFEALWTPARARVLENRMQALCARAASATETLPFSTEPWRGTPAHGGHEQAVAACRARIYAGDLFQANVCVRLESRLRGDPVDLFTAAVQRLAPDRAAFLAGPWGAVASLSPELFLERCGRRVRSAPIKGTRRRPGESAAADARERAALQRSAKDRAENVMIVDLVRNDLGRVCVPGSIAVDSLAQPRAHTGVWHLVSEVSGTLPAGLGDAALVRAAFPPGSVTGAPKVAALNVIAELESTPRDVYTGAIGFASPVSGLELNVAIRTFEFAGERAWLGVGGGIVADSDPAAEADECLTKALPLLDAIQARLGDRADPAVATGARQPSRLGPKPISRPDPAAGVFETLLVADGRPVALARHLARLQDSVCQLYGKELPEGLAEELTDRALHVDRARMRVSARPGRSGICAEVELTPAPDRRSPVRLHPVTVPGGLGAHKWIDRRLLDALRDGAGGEPLLCDLDGYVLESARANVFALDTGGRLLTPPADGRILPGVTRARVLELAKRLQIETVVRAVRLSEIARAEELFVTGSLGGIEPAHLAGSAPEPGAVTARLRGNLTACAVPATQT